MHQMSIKNLSQIYNPKVKILKICARVLSCCLACEIKPQQRICVCPGQITSFRNFMNKDVYLFLKS